MSTEKTEENKPKPKKFYKRFDTEEEIKEWISEKIKDLREAALTTDELDRAELLMDWIEDPNDYEIIATHIEIEDLKTLLELMISVREFVKEYPYKMMEKQLKLKSMGNYLN